MCIDHLGKIFLCNLPYLCSGIHLNVSCKSAAMLFIIKRHFVNFFSRLIYIIKCINLMLFLIYFIYPSLSSILSTFITKIVLLLWKIINLRNLAVSAEFGGRLRQQKYHVNN